MTLPSQVNINIPQAFKDAFGVYARFPVFILADKKPGTKQLVTVEDIDLGEYAPAAPGELGGQKHLMHKGRPIWDRFGFKNAFDLTLRDTDNDGNFYMPAVTTAEISQAKNIVKTPLVGLKGKTPGSVKEIMSLDDHVIVFRGLVINLDELNKYPVEQVNQLNKLYNINQSLPVVSKLLNNAHDINEVTFFDKNWPDAKGYSNIQPFEFYAYSDMPLILDLK